jgi:hypothetical protein
MLAKSARHTGLAQFLGVTREQVLTAIERESALKLFPRFKG